MPEVKNSLQKSDIRTMAKDISQLRRGVFIAKPTSAPIIEIKQANKVQDLKEKNDLNKILQDATQKRQEDKQQTVAPVVIQSKLNTQNPIQTILENNQSILPKKELLKTTQPPQNPTQNIQPTKPNLLQQKEQPSPPQNTQPPKVSQPPQINSVPDTQINRVHNQNITNIKEQPVNSVKQPQQEIKQEKIIPKSVSYDEKKMKFMEDIEKWASQSN